MSAQIPAPAATRIPTVRQADCRYCERYGRACGRHEDLTLWTPEAMQAHDRIVAHAYSELAAAAAVVEARQADVLRVAGAREQIRRGRPRTWTMTVREATEAARRIAFAVEASTAKDRAGRAISALAIAEEARDERRATVDRLEEVRDRNGRWQRFFLVTGGHIHASRSCHTLRPTTRLGWLPDLSGLDEAAAVAAHGPLLCSHCFPTAPVEWTVGPQPADDVCPGSKTGNYPAETARRGYCSGNYGVCNVCGERVTLTTSWALRTHKRPA